MSPVLRHALLVGAGGMLGSVLRYAVMLWVQRSWPAAPLPCSTLVVNLIGCAAIGALAGWLVMREPASAELRLFAGVGVLGGFTTFSAFGYETYALVRDGDPLRALANVALQVLLGLGAVWAGYTVLSRS
jgi:fluoride exporter